MRRFIAMKPLLLGLQLGLLLAVPGFARQPAAPAASPLDHLAGRWVLRGEIAGKPTTHDVTATWVLNRGYLQLHEVSREKDAAGRPRYEAIIYVTRDAKSGEVACLWLDSTASGMFAPDGVGRAAPSAGSIPFIFKDAGGSVSFTNTFAYDAKTDSWNWIMDNVVKGEPKPFGRVTLKRR
jgi:hypothetical protein